MMNLLRKIRALLRKEKLDTEMNEEMRLHLELQTRENIARGMSPEEARYAARRMFGGEEQIKEQCRDQRSWMWLEQWKQDVSYAIRSLAKNRTFALTALVTLTFGIGITTAIFTVVDTVLWRPLPYADAGQIVYSPRPFNWTTARDWEEAQTVLSRVERQLPGTKVLTGLGDATNVGLNSVSPGLFEMLGRRPMLGRAFVPDDAEAGSPRVAVVSHRFWQGELHGDPAVVGRTIELDEQTYTIVGVMPPDFAFPLASTRVWLPLIRPVTEAQWRQRVELIGRLRPGVEFAVAREAVKALNAQLNRSRPQPNEWQVDILPSGPRANSADRKMMLLMLGAVGFVLLIACANVANLLLTRGAVRQREFAVRVALGAGRGRLFRQVLAESLVLAVTGALGGWLVAFGAVKVLWFLAPYDMRFLTINEVALNWRALGFIGGVAGLATLLCGMVPAWRAARDHATPALGAGMRTAPVSRPRQRWQEGLVIVQAALAFVLLVGAGLLIRGFSRLNAVNPGFDIKHLAALTVQLPNPRYPTETSRRLFYQQVRERIAQLPGVQAATVALGIPPKGGGFSFGVAAEVEGRAPEKLGKSEILPYNAVDGDYFRALGIPLLRGRNFDARDVAGAPRVAIINEPMARRFWPNSDPIGQRIRFDPKQEWLTVIGVAGDVKAMELTDESGTLEYYRAIAQDGYGAYGTVAVRTAGNPQGALTSIREAVTAVDPRLPVSRLTTAEALMAETVDVPRFSLTVMLLFASAALLLAAVGLYGVISYTVVQRTPEIGIRMALGGSGGDIMRLILTRGMALAGAGLLLGLGAAMGLTRLLGSLLFEVSALDPATFGGVALGLAAVGVLACWLPARRAARLDPVVALRAE